VYEHFQALFDGDIDLQVRRTSAELIAAASDGRDRAASEMQATTRKMEIVADAARQNALEEGLAAGREAGRREALEESAEQPADVASHERLADAVRSRRARATFTKILDTSASCVRAVPRATL
jgi:flagellar biosynthesis/type III secretory pathway protein FliH